MARRVTAVSHAKRKYTRYYFFILGIIGVVTIVVLGIYIVITFGKILTINVSLDQAYKRVDRYKRGLQNYPSPERERFLKQQRAGLESIIAQLREYPIFWDKIITIDIATTSPLKFKEELFRIKRLLHQKARDNGVAFTKDIGFSPWEKTLPKPSQLEDLFQALEIVKEIGEIAIDSHVRAIDNIYVSEIAQIPYAQNGTQQTYYEREVRIRLIGNCSSLIEFLYGITLSEILLHVKDMRIYTTQSTPEEGGDNRAPSPQNSDVHAVDPMLVSEVTIVNTCL